MRTAASPASTSTADIRYQFYSAADLDGAGAFGTA
jgi:hypothetical protein